MTKWEVTILVDGPDDANTFKLANLIQLWDINRHCLQESRFHGTGISIRPVIESPQK